jgi:hypothetical protein
MSMVEGVVALIVDESKWLTASLGTALVAVAVLMARHRRGTVPTSRVTVAAMSLFFALTIGTMAFGHLLAVTVKLAIGTLEGSTLVYYLIGVALAIPSWALVAHVPRVLWSDPPPRTVTLTLNAWVAVTLLAMGLHNLPLAAPGVINALYLLQSRRAVGWTLVGAFVVVNLGLFAGSIVFLASGQSFEQFRNIE